jgi:hypothetical protein
MKCTLDADFSSLNAPQAEEWIKNFYKTAEAAFAGMDDRPRLLGNLLVIERFVNTVRQGLADNSQNISDGLIYSLDLLWDYLYGKISPLDFQDFANDFYACLLAHNVGMWEDDAPRDFYIKYIGKTEHCAYEWMAIEWTSVLLISLVGIAGGRVDFEDFEDCLQIDFYPAANMADILEEICVGLINPPLLSHKGSDLAKAHREVRKTLLFQQGISCIQGDLKTALTAKPEQFPDLRNEYQKYTILPDGYAAKMLEY